ncbi:FABP family protein [soil metagenome]
MSQPALHPGLEALAGLLGTWQGEGVGEYPTISSFGYSEEVTFGHVGKPFLAYGQRTRATDDGRPLHAESGYWRVPAPGQVELVLAHPTGVTEIATGTVTQFEDPDGTTLVIDLVSTAVGLSPTAKWVTGVERTFRLRADTLDYTLRLGAVGQSMQHHLAASLQRVSAP